MAKPSKKAIHLGPRFHAEPGRTKGHLHDLYTTYDVGENDRIHVGQISKAAVTSWRNSLKTLARRTKLLDQLNRIR